MPETRSSSTRRQSQPRRRSRGEPHRPRAQAEPEEQDRGQKQEAPSWVPDVRVTGWAFVLLILTGYFVWMIVEMGAHSVNGAAPMIGLLVAAAVGSVAAGLALVAGSKGRDNGRED